MVKTFQRADVKKYGTMAKIIPMTNEVEKHDSHLNILISFLSK